LKNILLVLSASRQSSKTIDIALNRAKSEGALLSALFILDSKVPESIFESLTDNAFAGEKPSEQLQASILMEHRERGTKKVLEIGEMAEKMGVHFEPLIKEGDFVSECLSVINEKKSDLVIITRERRSFLSRFVFGSVLESVRSETDSELLIVEE